jgi:hypothetical protein
MSNWFQIGIRSSEKKAHVKDEQKSKNASSMVCQYKGFGFSLFPISIPLCLHLLVMKGWKERLSPIFRVSLNLYKFLGNSLNSDYRTNHIFLIFWNAQRPALSMLYNLTNRKLFPKATALTLVIDKPEENIGLVIGHCVHPSIILISA